MRPFVKSKKTSVYFLIYMYLALLTIDEIASKVHNQCPQLSIGSLDSPKTQYDIVDQGTVSDLWSATPTTSLNVPVDSVKEFEYFYVKLNAEPPTKLSPKFSLNFSDPVFVNSTASLIEINNTHFILEVVYKCQENANSIIDYKLSVETEECNKVLFGWRKQCGGSKTIHRQGFSVDLEKSNGARENIVKDGSSSYFDEDSQNLKTVIPAKQQKISIFLYMSEVKNASQFNSTNNLDKQIWDILKSNKETKFSGIDLVYDKMLLEVSITSMNEKGGFVSNVHEELLSLNVTCLHEFDRTALQVIIKPFYHTDISIVLVKQCKERLSEKYLVSLFEFLILLGFFALLSILFLTAYNIIFLGQRGISAIPYFVEILKKVVTTRGIAHRNFSIRVRQYLQEMELHERKKLENKREDESEKRAIIGRPSPSDRKEDYGTI